MKKLNPMEFAEFVEQRAQAHDGYIMCAVGQSPKDLNEWYFEQYADRSQYSAKQEAQARAWRETAQRVWDCQGLADGYVTEMTGVATNVRARNNYADWCGIKGDGVIPAARRVPGAAVFMESSYIHHVGFLLKPVIPADRAGDWYVGEARGVMYGVVITKLSERGWNKWGWMTKYFDYSMFGEIPNAPEYGWRILRRGMSGSDVAALQRDLISLGYSCGKWGADGEFGVATEGTVEVFQHDHNLTVDGIAGAKTIAELDELLPDDGEEQPVDEPEKIIQITQGRTWNVRTAPSKTAAKLGYVKSGDMLSASGEETEGWIGVMFGGEAAWVSKKALE